MRHAKSGRTPALRQHAGVERLEGKRRRVAAPAPVEAGPTFSLKDVMDPYWSWRFIRMNGA